MDYPFTLPGHPDLNLTLRPGGFISSAKILKDGVPLKRNKGAYQVPLVDGTTLELKLKTGLDVFSPKVLFAGQKIEVLPPISPLWLTWTYLPVLLLFVGGALGGGLGAAGAIAAQSALRSNNLPSWAKILLALALPPLSVLLYLVIAVFITMKLPH